MRCEHAQSLLTTSTEAPPVRPCLAVRPTSATAAGGRHPRGCRWHRACLHSASKYVLVLATSRPLAQLCLIISRLAMMSHTVSIFLYRGNSGRSNRFVLAVFPYSGVARSSILIHDSRKYERQPPLTIAVLPGSDLHLGCIASCTVADLNSICSSENAPAERPFDCTSQGKSIEQHVVTIRRVQYAQTCAMRHSYQRRMSRGCSLLHFCAANYTVQFPLWHTMHVSELVMAHRHVSFVPLSHNRALDLCIAPSTPFFAEIGLAAVGPVPVDVAANSLQVFAHLCEYITGHEWCERKMLS